MHTPYNIVNGFWCFPRFLPEYCTCNLVCFDILCSLVPIKVSGVTVNKAVISGRPALIVRWTRHNDNERVTGYQVQYRRGTSGEWREERVSSVSTSTYLENLASGTSYQVRVNALSDIGNGPVGDIRGQTTYNGMAKYYVIIIILFRLCITPCIFCCPI